jgi:CheY-like chemotaxis protein
MPPNIASGGIRVFVLNNTHPGGGAMMVDIMILDDDPLTRAMLESLFTTVGYTVVQADNGIDGLLCVQTHTPRVLLIDLYLPGMDGLMFVRRLQSMPFIQRPHLFFMSVNVPLHLVDLGQRATFTKPFDLEDLLDQVARVLPLPAQQSSLRERWAG